MLSISFRQREPVSLLWKLEQTEGISSFVSEMRSITTLHYEFVSHF